MTVAAPRVVMPLRNVEAPDAESAPVLRAVGLGRQFSGRHGVVTAFASIDLTLAAGEVVCLLGPSGCGKSSLLAALAGLQPPSAGSVWLGESKIVAPDPRVAVLFQDPALLPWLDLSQNVAFGLRLRHGPRLSAAEVSRRVSDVIDRVGLRGFERAHPAQLSGGMAQRVALARALAREPAVLLMDEPFSALDAITRLEMQRLLLNAISGRRASVLLVTHDIDEALRLGDRVILMGRNPGRLHRQWRPRRATRTELPAADPALRDEIFHELSDLLSVQGGQGAMKTEEIQ